MGDAILRAGREVHRDDDQENDQRSHLRDRLYGDQIGHRRAGVAAPGGPHVEVAGREIRDTQQLERRTGLGPDILQVAAAAAT